MDSLHANGRLVIECEPEAVQDNPYQPRRHYGSADLKELADSIARLGQLQPALGRRVNGDVQLAFGHSRARACAIAGQPLTVEIRELTDEDMAKVALAENRSRTDLTPIDEARAFKRMIDDFGWTQDRVAEEVGLSRPVVTNKLRLLELPENILEAVEEGRCSERKAQALMPLVSISDEDLAVYKREYSYSTQPDQVLKDLLSEKVTSTTARERVGQITATLDRERERRRQDEKRRKKLDLMGGGVLDLKQLNWDQYTRIDKKIKGCTKDCECRRVALDHDGREVQVCIDQKKYRNLQGQASKEANKLKREKLRSKEKRVIEKFQQLGGFTTQEFRAGAMALATSHLRSCRADGIRSAVKAMGLDQEKFGVIGNAAGYHTHRDDVPALLEELSNGSNAELFNFVYLCVLLSQIGTALGEITWGGIGTPLVDAYLKSVEP